MSQDSAVSSPIPAPHPDNVDALADAVNRFHAKLDTALQNDQDLTRIFAGAVINRASITVHYSKDGDA